MANSPLLPSSSSQTPSLEQGSLTTAAPPTQHCSIKDGLSWFASLFVLLGVLDECSEGSGVCKIVFLEAIYPCLDVL